MIYIEKLRKDNNLSYENISKIMGISRKGCSFKFTLKNDFTIKDLEKIKDYFVILGIIDENFDIGDFLNEVEEENKNEENKH